MVVRLGDIVVLLNVVAASVSTGLLGSLLLNNANSPTISVMPAVDAAETFYLPRASLGLIGSCFQPSAGETNACDPLDGSRYYIDGLPDTSAKDLLRPPPQSLAGFVWFSFVISVLNACFWLIYTVHRLLTGKRLVIEQKKDNIMRKVFNLSLKWFAFAAFVFGLSGCFCWYMLARKMIVDFNGYNDIRPGGRQLDDLKAKTARGFNFAWISFAALFHSVIILWVDLFTDEPTAAPATKA